MSLLEGAGIVWNVTWGIQVAGLFIWDQKWGLLLGLVVGALLGYALN